ncbi:MAG TPA: hypothetical protein VFS81_27990 [Candidatus Binatia bacterium]|nr:hypothetical protein [Candidatus Binatia bacterium]
MNQVLLLVGGMLIGALSSAIGALGCGGDEHRRHALHGGAICLRSQGADDTVKKGTAG